MAFIASVSSLTRPSLLQPLSMWILNSAHTPDAVGAENTDATLHHLLSRQRRRRAEKQQDGREKYSDNEKSEVCDKRE